MSSKKNEKDLTPERATYHRLVAIKYMLPEWLRYRLDPYNTSADRFIAQAAASLPSGSRVLDAGAGECRHKIFFEDARYYGTDNAVGDCIAYDYAKLSFLSDITALPVADRVMEAILSVNVLEHIKEPGDALTEWFRVLRSKGHLFMVSPLSWQVHQAPNDFMRFTCFGLEYLLKKAGFVNIDIRPVGGTFWNLGLRSLYLLTHFRGRLFPFAIIFSPLFAIFIPLLCFYLDKLDQKKEDTIGYLVTAQKI